MGSFVFAKTAGLLGHFFTMETAIYKEVDHTINCSRQYLHKLILGDKHTLKVSVILQVQKGDTISIMDDGKRYVFDVMHVNYLENCVLTLKYQTLKFLNEQAQ